MRTEMPIVELYSNSRCGSLTESVTMVLVTRGVRHHLHPICHALLFGQFVLLVVMSVQSFRRSL